MGDGNDEGLSGRQHQNCYIFGRVIQQRGANSFALRWSGFDMDTRTLMVTETAYNGKFRDFGKTEQSLHKVHLPEGLAKQLGCGGRSVQIQSRKHSSSPMRASAMEQRVSSAPTNTAQVLKSLSGDLGLPKLNFQVLRQSEATLAQTQGSVKDVQGSQEMPPAVLLFTSNLLCKVTDQLGLGHASCHESSSASEIKFSVNALLTVIPPAVKKSKIAAFYAAFLVNKEIDP